MPVKQVFSQLIAEVSERHPHIDFSKAIDARKSNRRYLDNLYCPEHDFTFGQYVNHLKRSTSCKICGDVKTGIGTKKALVGRKVLAYRNTQEKIIEQFQEAHGPDRYDYSKVVYETLDNNVLIRCLICSEWFEQTPMNHRSGSGCSTCNRTKASLSKRLALTEVITQFQEAHGPDRYDYSKVVYEKSNDHVLVICNQCSTEFPVLVHHHRNGSGCPNCVNIKNSYGVQAIAQWLEENGIEYEVEKWFDSCRNKRPLPFDFWIPKYNRLIEFDGKFHYEIKYSSVDFLETRLRDYIKDQWAEANGIPLLRIPYWERDNIPQILEKFFHN